ncbi:MAG: YdcF family protein [Pseudomonadota bacterium]
MGLVRRILQGILFVALVFYGPLAWHFVRSDIRTVETSNPVEAALVFGALVRSGTISPLHAQRLDTAIALHRGGKADVIVVSNALSAAQTMRDYLLNQGIDPSVIELDGQAEHTPDTCRNELDRGRSVAFIPLWL